MVEIPSNGEKMAELNNNSVINPSSQVKVEEVVIEHDDTPSEPLTEIKTSIRTKKEDPFEVMRKQMEDAERATQEARERAISAERERDAARAQVNSTRENLAKAEKEKIDAQEAAIVNRVETAKAEVENAERALEEAIDTGKPAREQINLQKILAQAVYKLNGAESAKTHFDNWKEREKNKVAQKSADDGITPAARAWIDAHPRFNTDKKYKRVAVAAHEDALDDGIAADSPEYFRRINTALADAGMGDDTNTSSISSSQRNVSSPTSTAAPVNHDSTAAGARGGTAAEEQRSGRRIFKLDAEMRRMALQTYGKNSTFKLSDEEAYKRYAARQIEIRDKIANGERI